MDKLKSKPLQSMALACLLAFSESGVTVLELFKAALFKVHGHTDGDPTLRLLELLSESK